MFIIIIDNQSIIYLFKNSNKFTIRPNNKPSYNKKIINNKKCHY